MVSLVKHVFKSHVVFQFNVSNTIPDTVLDEVSVLMAPAADTGLTEDFIIPIDSLNPAKGSGQVYVSFTRDDPESYAAGSFGCTLRFVSKEVDPSSGEPEEEGYQDDYQVEDCDLGAADVSAPRVVGVILTSAVHCPDLCHVCKRVGEAGRGEQPYRDVCTVVFRVVTG